MALDDIDASFEGHANRATTNGIDLANLATVHSINGNNTCAISYDHQLTLVSIKRHCSVVPICWMAEGVSPAT